MKTMKKMTKPNPKKASLGKSQKFCVAVDPDGNIVTTTLRADKNACLRVLTQGSSTRWKEYSKRGYTIREDVELFNRGQRIS